SLVCVTCPVWFAARLFVGRPYFALWTAKASSFAPAFNFSRSQVGSAPLPAHTLPDLSRYLVRLPAPVHHRLRLLAFRFGPEHFRCWLDAGYPRFRRDPFACAVSCRPPRPREILDQMRARVA